MNDTIPVPYWANAAAEDLDNFLRSDSADVIHRHAKPLYDRIAELEALYADEIKRTDADLRAELARAERDRDAWMNAGLKSPPLPNAVRPF